MHKQPLQILLKPTPQQLLHKIIHLYLKTTALSIFAQNSYGKNITEKTSEIADNVNAILAINGDYYGAQENGYVIRNGVRYRASAKSGNEDLVVYADGSFEIINESNITTEELLEKQWQAIHGQQLELLMKIIHNLCISFSHNTWNYSGYNKTYPEIQKTTLSHMVFIHCLYYTAMWYVYINSWQHITGNS